MSHSGHFIHFIISLNYKSKQVIKGKLGKPLLYGWGGLFRGRKNKGTSGTFPLLNFCQVHTPENFLCPERKKA